MGHSINHNEHMGSLTFNQIAHRAWDIEERIVTYTHSIPSYMHDGDIDVEMVKTDPFVQFLCAQHEELVKRAVSISREVEQIHGGTNGT